MKRRLAQLPLHTGKAPAWLFRRMTKLAGAVTMAIVDEYGPAEMLRRLSDPWWFQAFGCVLGFDWHSSGVTTVTCGALKEAANVYGADLGIHVAGGKGATSRRTPAEIADAGDRFGIAAADNLIAASRMSAKVDSAAVQDGYALYHHAFFFTTEGEWCVVQQGMNAEARQARRYHWLSEGVRDFVCEPHAAIRDLADKTANAGDSRPLLLNMVAAEAESNRRACIELLAEHPERILEEIGRFSDGPTLFAPKHHRVLPSDVDPRRLRKLIVEAHERHPQDYEALLGGAGIGPAAVRSLALLAEIIFDAPVSRRDPAARPADPSICAERHWADYSYAHGGKDGTPFPVDRQTYDRSIGILMDAVRRARLGQNEKIEAMRRLAAR